MPIHNRLLGISPEESDALVNNLLERQERLEGLAHAVASIGIVSAMKTLETGDPMGATLPTYPRPVRTSDNPEHKVDI